jgi:hypothetical protein
LVVPLGENLSSQGAGIIVTRCDLAQGFHVFGGAVVVAGAA